MEAQSGVYHGILGVGGASPGSAFAAAAMASFSSRASYLALCHSGIRRTSRLFLQRMSG